jgi:hypothetical protein
MGERVSRHLIADLYAVVGDQNTPETLSRILDEWLEADIE